MTHKQSENTTEPFASRLTDPVTEVILDSFSDSVFTVDHDFRITDFNKAAEKTTGFSGEEAIGKFCRNIFRANMCNGECALQEMVLGYSPASSLLKCLLVAVHRNRPRLEANPFFLQEFAFFHGCHIFSVSNKNSEKQLQFRNQSPCYRQTCPRSTIRKEMLSPKVCLPSSMVMSTFFPMPFSLQCETGLMSMAGGSDTG